jgi:queuosine precursor transporter
MNLTLRAAPPLAFLACVLAANYITSRYGMVPVGFGFTATAGTYLAGVSFVLRDAVQDTAGRWTAAGLVLAGAGLSYLIADPFIALASGVAFLVSEFVDLGIYTPLRRCGYVRAAAASNVAGAVVDTFVFLAVAGFPITSGAVSGQIIGKLTITAVVVLAVGGARAVLRQPLNRAGA